MSDGADPASRFERYAAAIYALPEQPDRESLCSERFLIHQGGRLRIYYAPFDHVNGGARVALVGVTPGWQQMQIAYRVARDGLRAGTAPDAVLAAVKTAASFAGPMRRNLLSMLDEIGLPDALGIAASSSLFDDRTELLHSTSAMRYPVFVDGRNYTGSRPALLKTRALRDFVERCLTRELDAVTEALIIPLGTVVERCLGLFVDQGVLDRRRCLFGFPHPSGANGHRRRQFDRRRDDLERTVRDWFAPPTTASTLLNPRTWSRRTDRTDAGAARAVVETKLSLDGASKRLTTRAPLSVGPAARTTPRRAGTISVPEARDGSRFAVNLARPDGSYVVGPKGAERRIHGYMQALEWLTHEHRSGRSAYWRRPSATSGMLGIVKAVRWVAVEQEATPSTQS